MLPGLALVGALVLAAPGAFAGPGDAAAVQGLSLARRGECVKAVPLLEEAELARHRPSTAVPLADCYVALGDLLHAGDLYRAVVAEEPARFWVRTDYNAKKTATAKADEIDARIPTVRFEPDEDYEDLRVEVSGHLVTDPDAPRQVAADVSVPIVIHAKGFEEFTDKLIFNERERRTVHVHLEPLASSRKPRASASASSPTWLMR